MSIIFVYGTLKEGCYNHTRFGFDKGTKFLEDAVLRGARMYDLGEYPCVVLTGNEEEQVHGEVYEFVDDACEKEIRRMEFGSGYVEREVRVNSYTATIFVYLNPPEDARSIESGRWVDKKIEAEDVLEGYDPAFDDLPFSVKQRCYHQK